jgi:calcium-dependent protein kinase
MNHNVYVEYEEFVRGAVNKEQFLSDNVLKFAFRYFDKDGNTEVDYREIESIFKDNIYDKQKIHEGLKKIIDEVDSNKDGKISYHEFCVVMKKMIIP